MIRTQKLFLLVFTLAFVSNLTAQRKTTLALLDLDAAA